MNLNERFTGYIQQQGLFEKNDRLLLAVSGGLDSVVLCHLCREAGYKFSLAHCNFGLRGEESTRDAVFVRTLSDTMGVGLHVQLMDAAAYAAEHKVSVQVAARNLRYAWFSKLLDDSRTDPAAANYKYLLTAHHRDDNIETVLMNFLKGTGIAGLSGIEPRREKIVRPLLWASREELSGYAQEKGLSWVHDSSNDKTDYTRNLFRNVIIPQIEQAFPSVKENLARNIERFDEVEALYLQALDQHKKRLLQFRRAEVFIPVAKLARTTPLKTIVFEIIKDFGFRSSQVPDVITLLSSESGKFITSSSHRLLRNRAWLIVSPLEEQEQAILLIQNGESCKLFGNYKLDIRSLSPTHVHYSDDGQRAFVDAKQLQYPLMLRRWKEGDYFYPLGMTKKKKVARFLISEKLSLSEKEKVWVLESNKKIVWVVGYRIDNRFRILPVTTHVLQLSIKETGTPVPQQ